MAGGYYSTGRFAYCGDLSRTTRPFRWKPDISPTQDAFGCNRPGLLDLTLGQNDPSPAAIKQETEPQNVLGGIWGRRVSQGMPELFGFSNLDYLISMNDTPFLYNSFMGSGSFLPNKAQFLPNPFTMQQLPLPPASRVLMRLIQALPGQVTCRA
jgi:hypothetical protein